VDISFKGALSYIISFVVVWERFWWIFGFHVPTGSIHDRQLRNELDNTYLFQLITCSGCTVKIWWNKMGCTLGPKEARMKENWPIRIPSKTREGKEKRYTQTMFPTSLSWSRTKVTSGFSWSEAGLRTIVSYKVNSFLPAKKSTMSQNQKDTIRQTLLRNTILFVDVFIIFWLRD
jgi:hypothetical protein